MHRSVAKFSPSCAYFHLLQSPKIPHLPIPWKLILNPIHDRVLAPVMTMDTYYQLPNKLKLYKGPFSLSLDKLKCFKLIKAIFYKIKLTRGNYFVNTNKIFHHVFNTHRIMHSYKILVDILIHQISSLCKISLLCRKYNWDSKISELLWDLYANNVKSYKPNRQNKQAVKKTAWYP